MGEELWPPLPPGYATEWNTFFPNSGGDLRSDAHQSQIIGGDADVDHTQIIRGIQSNYWGDISPHPPRVLAPLARNLVKNYEHLFCFPQLEHRLSQAPPPHPN